jgi:hypothetical protein
MTNKMRVLWYWCLCLWNRFQTRFQDPELEDEFLAFFVDSTLRWTWHASLGSLAWNIVRLVSMHLQIYNPRAYHLSGIKVYCVNTRSEFVMWKYWSTAIELVAPVHLIIMLWTKERMQCYNHLLSLPSYASIFPSGGLIPKFKKCIAGSIPYQAVIHAISEEQIVLSLMLVVICPVIGDGFYLTGHSQSQLSWIMACVGTMLHSPGLDWLVSGSLVGLAHLQLGQPWLVFRNGFWSFPLL